MHLTIRVAWHDNKWNGTICSKPSYNSFCLALDRIREGRKDEIEEKYCGKHWKDIDPDNHPPCKGEAGGFMSSEEWVRMMTHPYQNIEKTKDTHGHLKPTPIRVPPYSTFAVPFWWMNKSNEKDVQKATLDELPEEEESPFPNSPWLFSPGRQKFVNNLFFNQLTADESLVFFYTKEGHPLGDDIRRLIVGIGTVTKIGKLNYFDSKSSKKAEHPNWDRLIFHSIRLDGKKGFLFPYHEYLESTGDPVEDERRKSLLREIALVPALEHTRAFSYMSEVASNDIALSTLTQAVEIVRKIKKHGIAAGPWDEREEWLNEQIARVWKERGAFPGLGSALEAIDLRLGTLLVHDLYAEETIKKNQDPWKTLDSILKGKKAPPKKAYKDAIDAIQKTWNGLAEERKQLLQLLSRFDITPKQTKRWFEMKKRPGKIQDKDILKNPYVICETDQGDASDGPISIGVIDRGLLPDSTISAKHPVPSPSNIKSMLDPRRVRAGLVSILRAAALGGDSLLSESEALSRLEKIDLAQSCVISPDWLNANVDSFSGVIERFELNAGKTGKELEESTGLQVLQLHELKEREEKLQRILNARAMKELPSTGVEWESLIKSAITQRNGIFDAENKRHVMALREQALALEKITTRKLSILTGSAGTGKTSALGALFLNDKIQKSGILLLAPTGKATVLLGKSSGANAKTIAGFLYGLKRYNGTLQQPLFDGEKKHAVEKTIVIDECSMLTTDLLYAVLEALDLTHVQRIILVGDPNQLPPIGVGRPFADFIGYIESCIASTSSKQKEIEGALGKLSVEVRASIAGPSDTLRLATWFTRDNQVVDADSVWNDLESGKKLNDLEIRYWDNSTQLHELLLDVFVAHLGLKNPNDVEGFNVALGMAPDGKVDFSSAQGAENFQILSAVRMHPYGIYELNRFIQSRFRHRELELAKEDYSRMKLGDEDIVLYDKVIQIRNQTMKSYNWTTRQPEEIYVANGEVGICASEKRFNFLNVLFAGKPNQTIGYAKWNFANGYDPLELAYALTVHKAQGSEFKKVFVVLPKKCRPMSRELLYTALTRSRDQLVLLIEGKDISCLYEYIRPEASETARRNSNLFCSSVRMESNTTPFAEHLIHRTLKGHMVRSKSELVIANMLFQMKIQYEYEKRYEGSISGGIVLPDFIFADAAGEPIIWEHLGMLNRSDYRESWERKREWYKKNKFEEGRNLFTTHDDDKGGLDSKQVNEVASIIKKLI